MCAEEPCKCAEHKCQGEQSACQCEKGACQCEQKQCQSEQRVCECKQKQCQDEQNACQCGKNKCGCGAQQPLEQVATDQAPAALGAYSQAVKANGFVFVSGQLGINPSTGELAGATAGEQAAQAMKNIAAVLTAAGSSMDRIVRATIYLADVNDFAEVDAAYSAALTGAVKPARVAFGGNAIPKGALVEIDAIAAV